MRRRSIMWNAKAMMMDKTSEMGAAHQTPMGPMSRGNKSMRGTRRKH